MWGSDTPRARALPLLLAGIAAGWLGGGCGNDAPAGTAPRAPAALTADERRLVRDLEGRIQAHCVRVRRSLVDPSLAPTPAQVARAFAAADRLVALAAAKPEAPTGAGQDLRLLVSDVIENLEGSNCDPRLIARLEQGLSRIPVE